MINGLKSKYSLGFVFLALIAYGISHVSSSKKSSVSAEAVPVDSSEVTTSCDPLSSETDSMIFVTSGPCAEEIVAHHGFVLSYNNEHLIPNWVAWLLTKERVAGTEKRADNFQPDTSIQQGPIALDSDYRASGYDRGHMCPAADCKHLRASMNECFLLSNICPQSHALNAGDWKELEELSRKWAKQYDSIYIVCGPVLDPKVTYEKIGENKVTVPQKFFKVFWRFTAPDAAQAIGFVFTNDDTNQPLASYVLSVDEIEQMTGHNFFSNFPEELQNQAEAIANPSAWSMKN